MPAVAHGRGPLGGVAAAAAAAAASVNDKGGPPKYLQAKARPINGQANRHVSGSDSVISTASSNKSQASDKHKDSMAQPPKVPHPSADLGAMVSQDVSSLVTANSSKEEIIEHLINKVPLNDLLTVLLAMRRASQPPVRTGNPGAGQGAASSWQGNTANQGPPPMSQNSGANTTVPQAATLSAAAPAWSPMLEQGPDAAGGYPANMSAANMSGYMPNPYAQAWVPGQSWTPNEYAQPFTMPDPYVGAQEYDHDQGFTKPNPATSSPASFSGPPKAGSEWDDDEEEDGEDFDPAMMLSDVAAYLGSDDEQCQ